MTDQEQIPILESLAAIDADLSAIESELKGESDALGHKKEQLRELEAKIGQAQEAANDMDRTRGDLVQEARQMSVQMERSRDKLARCRTEREVNAAQREIEELRKLYRDREVEIEKLDSLIEQARQDMAGHEAKRGELLGELGSSEGAVTSKMTDLESQAAALRSQRDEQAKGLPPVLYRRYEMIRKRLGMAIASTTEGTCSGCHMMLPPMMFQELRRDGRLDQCPSCRRIIYYREAAGAEASSGGTDAVEANAESDQQGAGEA